MLRFVSDFTQLPRRYDSLTSRYIPWFPVQFPSPEGDTGEIDFGIGIDGVATRAMRQILIMSTTP